MRVAAGHILQETNTFCPVETTLDFFKAGYLYKGAEIRERAIGARTEMAGFVHTADARGIEIVPVLAAWSVSGGRVVHRDFEYLLEELLKGLEEAGPVDGVLLALHGSMCTTEDDDPDGAIIEAVRRQIGDTPFVVTLDFHANITRRMVRSCDAIVGYRTFPHVDMFETGVRGAELLFNWLEGKTGRPVMAYTRMPMITPAEGQMTTHEPMSRIIRKMEEFEQDPRILSTSIFAVQPWLDLPDVGWAAVAVAQDDGAARHAAETIGQMAWDFREGFRVELVSVKDAVERTLALGEGPVVWADSADSPSAGAPGDSTVVLQQLLELGVDRRENFEVLHTMVDPEVVEQAIQVGVGGTFTTQVGGKRDTIYSRPVTVTARVKLISDGRFRFKGVAFSGLEADMGRTAVLEVGAIKLVVSERPAVQWDPEMYRSVGLEPRDANAVVIKSPAGFRPNYEPMAKDILILDVLGISSPNLAQMPFKRIPHPTFPFHEVGERKIVSAS